MTQSDKIKNDIFSRGYVKRLDLRPEEQSGEPQDLQWWITHKDHCSEPRVNRRISLHDCNEFTDIYPVYEDIDLIKDPIDVISFFCDCHDRKVYPPNWVMDDLYKRFSSYFDDNLKGKSRGLGEYFSEPKNGNRRSIFRSLAMCDAMLEACMNVDRLVNWFYRPLNKALDIVAIHLEQQQALISRDWIGERSKGREALRVAHQEWSRKRKVYLEFIPRKVAIPTAEDRLALLKRLGHDSLTNNLDLQVQLEQGMKN